MKLGLAMFPTDTAIQPSEFARAAEERGFESIWFPEHSHIPASRETPWGGVPDAAPLPEMYWRTHDQFVALTAAAGATTRIKLASGITLVAQHDPIWLAKKVASLDHVSGGRFIFGIGFGWNREEMANHGVVYRTRHRLIAEKIAAMKAIWTEDEASHSGEFVNFDRIWSWPKPAQQPHPPIVIGTGAGPLGLGAVADYADGWLPIRLRDGLGPAIEALRGALAEAGRDLAEIEITYWAAQPTSEFLEELAEHGVTRAVFSIPPEGPQVVLPLMDELAELLG